jgi:hypothetical protein
MVIYYLISTKNRLPASRIEKYAGNCCFECRIESSKMIIIFVLLQHGWSEYCISTHQASTVYLASIFNAAIIRPRRFWLAFFCSKRNLNKKTDIWDDSYRLRLDTLRYYPRIGSTLQRHHHKIRQRIVPSGSRLPFFFEKQSE